MLTLEKLAKARRTLIEAGCKPISDTNPVWVHREAYEQHIKQQHDRIMLRVEEIEQRNRKP